MTAHDNQNELPLGGAQRLLTSSAKVRKPVPGAPFSWTYSYTAFSEVFAEGALDFLGAAPSKTVLDPFVGSGTTGVAAISRGSKFVGIDVNPFSALLSRARLATKVKQERVYALLNAIATNAESDRIDDVLLPEDRQYALIVVERIAASIGLTREKLWKALLSNNAGKYDTEVVTLLVLCIAARSSAIVARGSNPIWLRKDVNGNSENRVSLIDASAKWADIIVRDLLARPLVGNLKYKIINVDVTRHSSSVLFDICLTSPPYLNRLDYVVANLPELSILNLIMPLSMDALRKSMIGTTQIVSKKAIPIPLEWGALCADTLNNILNHKSYASQKYYYYTYLDYFYKLYKALIKITHWIREEGQGLIVIQDSFYKDIPVLTPEICVQMLLSLSCRANVIHRTSVRTHMGQMNPHQIAHSPRKQLAECVVHFIRKGGR